MNEKIKKEIRHKVTAIGSMPHRETEAALKLISQNIRHIPHWPQLPFRSSKEGFTNQYLNPMLNEELLTFKEGKVFFNDSEAGWESKLMRYYEKVLQVQENSSGYDTFAFPEEAADGFYSFLKKEAIGPECLVVKGQVSGPLSIGLQITDSQGNPSFYNQQLREITVKTLALNARWQIKKLEQLGYPVMIFVDDPGIYSYGTSSYVGLSRQDVQDSLEDIALSVKEEGGLSGMHSCAGVDWSIPLELSLDVINFDAYDYYTSMLVYLEQLKNFLNNGGMVAWGIVPTSESIEKEDSASLLKLLQERVEDMAAKGVPEQQLKEQMIVSPSCGAGTMSVEQAEKVYRELGGMAEELERLFG